MLFQIISLVIMAIFYGCYFLKMILQKRKGIRTDHMGEGKTGFVKFVEIFLKCVTILVPLAEVASIFFAKRIVPVPMKIAGCAVAFLGTVVFVISVVTMGESWRAGVSEQEKTELVTKGIYSWSRNPAFLGFDLLYIGMVMAWFNVPLFVLSWVAALMFHLQIVNVEEDFLIAVFGDAYLDYRKQVCRYFGRKRK